MTGRTNRQQEPSKATSQRESMNDTTGNAELGVVAFCSPDQLQGDEEASIRSEPQSKPADDDIENKQDVEKFFTAALKNPAAYSSSVANVSGRRHNEEEQQEDASDSSDDCWDGGDGQSDDTRTAVISRSWQNSRRFLAQLQLHQQMMETGITRRRSSSFNGAPRSQAQLSLGVNSLLDPNLAIDQDAMTWRKQLLADRTMENTLIDGICLLNTADTAFIHPLQAKKQFSSKTINGRPRLSRFHSVTSASSFNLFQSVTSVFSINSFKPSSVRRRSSNRGRMSQLRTRRFLDLTSFHEGDDDGEIYEPPPTRNTDDDDSMSIASSYSIRVISPKVEVCGRSKLSRNFLDLTLDPPSRRDSKNRWGSSRALPITQEDGSEEHDQTCSHTLNSDHMGGNSTGKQLNAGDNQVDVASVVSTDSEQLDIFTSQAWERADAVFIENVHDVARLLERNLMIKGFESPFWRFEEIVPRFDQLHKKIKESFDRFVSEASEGILEETTGEVANGYRRNQHSRVGKVVKPSFKLLQKADTTAIQPVVMNSRETSKPKMKFGQKLSKNVTDAEPDGGCLDASTNHWEGSALNMTIGFDDLQDGLRWRDDRDFVRNFLYQMRRDNTVTLPNVLAKGLEKRLSKLTTNTAVAIIDGVTSPLYTHREPHQVHISQVISKDAASHSQIHEEESAQNYLSSAVSALFGTSSLQSRIDNSDRVPTARDVQACAEFTDRGGIQHQEVPISNLTLLERVPSHSSLMTTESTDNNAWLKAGAQPADWKGIDVRSY